MTAYTLSIERQGGYRRLAYGPDGIIAAVSGRDVHMLDSQTGSLLEVIEEPHAGSITEMAWAPVKYDLGGKGVSILGTSGTDNVVRLWRSPKV
jgi:WD40 repeat protein